jgi:hypothetical protein
VTESERHWTVTSGNRNERNWIKIFKVNCTVKLRWYKWQYLGQHEQKTVLNIPKLYSGQPSNSVTVSCRFHARSYNVQPSNLNRTTTLVIISNSLYSFPQAGVFQCECMLLYLTTVTGRFLSAGLTYKTSTCYEPSVCWVWRVSAHRRTSFAAPSFITVVMLPAAHLTTTRQPPE